MNIKEEDRKPLESGDWKGRKGVSEAGRARLQDELVVSPTCASLAGSLGPRRDQVEKPRCRESQSGSHGILTCSALLYGL